MRYLSVTEIAKKWDVSERSVRNYCTQGRVNGAFLTGKTWYLKMQISQSVPTRRKNSQLPCWIFCRNRKQVSIPVAFTIRHRLI